VVAEKTVYQPQAIADSAVSSLISWLFSEKTLKINNITSCCVSDKYSPDRHQRRVYPHHCRFPVTVSQAPARHGEGAAQPEQG
jgi:hypothetical protein